MLWRLSPKIENVVDFSALYLLIEINIKYKLLEIVTNVHLQNSAKEMLNLRIV